MSTAVYFYKKLDKENKDKILEEIKKRNSLSDMIMYLKEEFWDGTLIHPKCIYMDNLIGLYTEGWQFAFNREFLKFCEPDEKSIKEFLTGKNMVIFDDRGVITFKEFWNTYVQGTKNGWTTKSYIEGHPELMELVKEMMLKTCDEEFVENGFRFCKL